MSITAANGVHQAYGLLEQGRVGNVPGQPMPAEIDKFRDALARAVGVERPVAVEAPVRVAQVTATGTVTDAGPSDPASAANTAVRGLELSGETDSTATTGTTILEGLGRLRGMFDAELNGLARQSSVSNPFDTAGMMNLQAQLVEFSLVVDVTSKLAGKSTQALDSLMKGQ